MELEEELEAKLEELQAETLAKLTALVDRDERLRRLEEDAVLLNRRVATAEAWAERYEEIAGGASSGFAAEQAAAWRAGVQRIDRAVRQDKTPAQILDMLRDEDRVRDALVAHLEDPDDVDKRSAAWRELYLFCGHVVDIDEEVQIDREHRKRHDVSGLRKKRAQRIIVRLKERPRLRVGLENDF